MQQEVEEKSIRLAVRTTEISARGMLRILMAIKHHIDEKRAQAHIPQEPRRGRQSVKELIGQGQGVTRVDLDQDGIRDFHKIAKKFGVDYAIIKDKGVEPPVYNVFFKARDEDAINKVISAYTTKYLHRQHVKASVIDKLNKAKEVAKELGKKVVERHKEAVR